MFQALSPSAPGQSSGSPLPRLSECREGPQDLRESPEAYDGSPAPSAQPAHIIGIEDGETYTASDLGCYFASSKTRRRR